jgi:hypothetical protein
MGAVKSSPTVRWTARSESQPLIWSVRVDVILMSNTIAQARLPSNLTHLPGDSWGETSSGLLV